MQQIDQDYRKQIMKPHNSKLNYTVHVTPVSVATIRCMGSEVINTQTVWLLGCLLDRILFSPLCHMLSFALSQLKIMIM